MNCERARKKLPLGVGKDLDVRTQAAFDEHVAGCLACFREVAAFRRSRAALKSARPVLGGVERASLHDFVLARIAANEPGPAAPIARTWSERLRFALPLAAVFVACAWAGVALSTGGGVAPAAAASPTASGPRGAARPSRPLEVRTVATDQLGASGSIVIPVARVPRPPRGGVGADARVVEVAPIEPWKIVRSADDF